MGGKNAPSASHLTTYPPCAGRHAGQRFASPLPGPISPVAPACEHYHNFIHTLPTHTPPAALAAPSPDGGVLSTSLLSSGVRCVQHSDFLVACGTCLRVDASSCWAGGRRFVLWRCLLRRLDSMRIPNLISTGCSLLLPPRSAAHTVPSERFILLPPQTPRTYGMVWWRAGQPPNSLRNSLCRLCLYAVDGHRGILTCCVWRGNDFSPICCMPMDNCSCLYCKTF